MASDKDWIPESFSFVEGKRIETDSVIGVFARADSREVTFEYVESDLARMNTVLEKFAKDTGLDFKSSSLYYHDRLKSDPTLLRMAHTVMNEKGNTILNDVYFVMDMISINARDSKTYIVRLNNWLDSNSKTLSVWEYTNGKFNRQKDVQGEVSNSTIHSSINSLYRWPGTEQCNPFKEIATTVNPSLKGRASR